jgi:YD repeat-containing protein
VICGGLPTIVSTNPITTADCQAGQADTHSTCLGYDGSDRLSQVKLPNGSTVGMSYNTAGQLSSYSDCLAAYPAVLFDDPAPAGSDEGVYSAVCGLKRRMFAKFMEDTAQVDDSRPVERDGLHRGSAGWCDPEHQGAVGAPDEIGVPV